MKKTLLVVLCVMLAGMFTGCASKKEMQYGQSATAMAKKAGAPDWYFKGGLKDDAGIYAIGRSNISDDIMAEKAARVDGRAALAQMIESAVNYIAENSLEYDGEAKTYFKEQSSVVASQVLVGSMQADRFDLDGTVSVLMFQPYEDLIKKFKSTALKQDDERLKSFLTDLTMEQLQVAFENTFVE